ncbi:MAG: 1-deoxy-D-xylulose-5-phosphate synthase, partial [Clostridiales bacterium]|nr:1-deoxy-D-xylulose-5-phosphate synthase [Clostridiales bacterium]
EELTRLAKENEKIVAVTAAMTDALGLRHFFECYPERSFDVGICEEHASVLCAAMATQGLKPYYAIYSTFLQRAFDEIIHDICGQDLPVTFCIDRAGITGADGETHQGVFDLSYLSFIPNLTVAIPKNIAEFRELLKLSASYRHPLAIRYPRNGTEGRTNGVEIGKFEVLHSSMSDIIVLAAGERCISLAENVLKEANERGVDFTLVNARFLRPLDRELLERATQKYIVTIEDNAAIGGFGDAINRFYMGGGKCVKSFGIDDTFVPHGSVPSLAQKYGLSHEKILNYILECHARG